MQTYQQERRKLIMDLDSHIRRIPDFPKPGILFYDISDASQHAQAWSEVVDAWPT
ncbi:MAG: hypothetical protein R3D03_08175 [Geminicoccaceae bacterium]